MSDIKKWGSDDEQSSTDTDLYKALQEMCDMWTTVCDAQGGEPEHVVQYTNAVTSLATARGESHE